MPTAKFSRKHGLSQGGFYKFISNYRGIEVSDAVKLKALDDLNAKIQWLPTDTMLDNVVLKQLLGEN